MNEEKVIQDLKDLIYNPGYDSIILQDKGGYTMWHNMFEALLKLIEKLQKELELNNECEIALNNRILDLENELNKEKEKNKELENADLTTVYMSGFYDGEKKWKDKIRALIKENVYPDTYNFKTISAKRLEKLLEE